MTKTVNPIILSKIKGLQSFLFSAIFYQILPYTFECRREGVTIRGTEYRPQGDNLPVAIVYHGFMSALVAAKNKYPIEKLSLFYPALCIPDGARDGKMQASKLDPNNVPETFRCGVFKGICKTIVK